ncbi:hypothetical protein [Acuticoccus mangrovi]|uniref:Uncharacterized protein n=1 Tax=Acuticoccus mangrovi TaxID=2796142 RepID=A0A934ML33_9HYPH|nr:hypothetical protein [Acuticoccus mangrovi]MBJ3775994.1 hypothetical protein [Acuticoccus mangrovi]
MQVRVDLQRKIIVMTLSRADFQGLESIVQWLIGHFYEPWIDDTMLAVSRDDLRAVNALMREVDRRHDTVTLNLTYRQESTLGFALHYARNELYDDPRVRESVRISIEAVAEDLMSRIQRVHDEIRRHEASR